MDDKELLDIYTDYLISSFGLTTQTGLSRLLNGAISHDRIQRFLATEPKTGKDLWLTVKPYVRQVQAGDGVIIVDDSIAEKPHTDENDIICWHYDHSKGHSIKGINFVTALYQVGDVSLPVNYQLVQKTAVYTDQKTGKQKRRSPLTKNEVYRQLLRQVKQNQIPFRYVLNDVWFASADNMKFVKHELEQDFVMPLKTNRKVALSLEDKQQGRYMRVDALDIEPDTVMTIYLEGVDFPLHLVKQVFTNGTAAPVSCIWSPAISTSLTTESPQSMANDGTWNPTISRSSRMLRWRSRPPKRSGRRATISLLLCVRISSWRC